jgi:hypothetical protein
MISEQGNKETIEKQLSKFSIKLLLKISYLATFNTEGQAAFKT